MAAKTFFLSHSEIPYGFEMQTHEFKLHTYVYACQHHLF